MFLFNQWKCYLAKWERGTNCTYHQKISLGNSFQTYALGNESVSLCVTALSAILVVFRKLALLFNTLAPGLLWFSCSAYSQAAFVRNPTYARQLLPAPCHASWWSVIFSSSLVILFHLSYPYLCLFAVRCVKPFVMGRGAEAVPVALTAIPCQRQQPPMHNGVIQYKCECIQKIRGRCCSESSAFCLRNLPELLVHYISSLNSLQVFPPPPRPRKHLSQWIILFSDAVCKM